MTTLHSTLTCPNCAEQALESIALPKGRVERCASCSRIFIAEELVAEHSDNKEACLATLAETGILRLPTSRMCPRCQQPLCDARVRSRGMTVTLCPTCMCLWIDPTTLQRLDQSAELAIQTGIEKILHPELVKETFLPSFSSLSTTSSSKAVAETAPAEPQGSPLAEPVSVFPMPAPRVAEPPRRDTAVSGLFRGVAKMFEGIADRFAGHPRPPSSSKPATKAAPVKEIPSPVKEAWKVEPLPPEPLPVAKSTEPAVAPPKPTLPEPVELKPEPVAAAVPVIPEPVVPIVEPIAPPEPPVPVTEPEPLIAAFKAAEPAPAPAPMQEMPMAPVVIPEEQPAKVPEPVVPEPRLIPVAAEVPLKPVVKKPAETKVSMKKPGVLNKFNEWLKPKPRPASRPAAKPSAAPAIPPSTTAASVENSTPHAPPVEAEKPVAAAPVEPARAPVSKPVIEEPPAPKPEPILEPVPIAPEPLAVPAAAVAAPAPAIPPSKPAPVAKKVKVKKEKAPGSPWSAKFVRWMPFYLPAGSVLIYWMASYEFDFGTAVLMALGLWGLARLLQLLFQYPFQPFELKTVSELSATDVMAWRGIPVEVHGQITVEGAQTARGPYRFVSEDISVAIDRFRAIDGIAQIFSVPSYASFKDQMVSIRGWYRPGGNPFIEVQEIRTEKIARKSMVRQLRWAMAGLAVFLSLLLLIVTSFTS
jgi:hypothetical protein